MFKDILKFDKQNPIISSLLGEIEGGKLTDELVKTFLDLTPSIKDLEVERLENLKESNKLSQLETLNKKS